MMANIYGVVAGHATHHKGYSDFVQHNSGEMPELVNSLFLLLTVTLANTKHEQYSGSPPLVIDMMTNDKINELRNLSLKVPTKSAATCTPGIQEDGRHSFSVNQQVTGKEKGRTANPTLWDACFFSHQENHNLAEQQDNYEIFVVQPSGVSLAFLRCSALSLRPQASSTQEEKLDPGLSTFSRSTLESISSINSCGKRIPFVADLLFTARVAIERSPYCARTPYRKTNGKKSIDVPQHLGLKCPNTLSVYWCKIAKPGSVGTLAGLLTTTLVGVTIMACLHDTQTRPSVEHIYWVFSGPYSCSPPKKAYLTPCQVRSAHELFSEQILVWAGQVPAIPCRSCSMTLIPRCAEIPVTTVIVGMEWRRRHA